MKKTYHIVTRAARRGHWMWISRACGSGPGVSIQPRGNQLDESLSPRKERMFGAAAASD
jgi:hypothetical protein